MGAAKHTCFECKRPPGGRHLDACSESSYVMQAWALRERYPKLRVLWPVKDRLFRATVQMLDGSRKTVHVTNPGVPMVGIGKRWTAGGVPRGDEKMNDRVDEFEREFIRVIREKPRRFREAG